MALGLTCGALAFLGGACDSGAGSPNSPSGTDDGGGGSGGAAGQDPAPVEMFAENDAWSRAEALQKLDDENEGVRAAVRLVRLADLEPLIVPQPLPAKFAAGLKVVRLSTYGVWALGHADPDDERVLRCPVLIDANENVTLPAEGLAEEFLVLHRSESAEVFPHLLILPDRVWFLTSEADTAAPSVALVLRSPQTVRFALGDREGYPYVRLMLRGESDEVQVAEYRWDPDEGVFAGPAKDKLPFPPGGKFVLDVTRSVGLTPVGGELPEPDEIDETPPWQQPDDDFGEWAGGGAECTGKARA